MVLESKYFFLNIHKNNKKDNFLVNFYDSELSSSAKQLFYKRLIKKKFDTCQTPSPQWRKILFLVLFKEPQNTLKIVKSRPKMTKYFGWLQNPPKQWKNLCSYFVPKSVSNYFKPHYTTSLLTSEITGYPLKYLTPPRLYLICFLARSFWWSTPSRTGHLCSGPGVFSTNWSGKTTTWPQCCYLVTRWTLTIWEK